MAVLLITLPTLGAGQFFFSLSFQSVTSTPFLYLAKRLRCEAPRPHLSVRFNGRSWNGVIRGMDGEVGFDTAQISGAVRPGDSGTLTRKKYAALN